MKSNTDLSTAVVSSSTRIRKMLPIRSVGAGVGELSSWRRCRLRASLRLTTLEPSWLATVGAGLGTSVGLDVGTDVGCGVGTPVGLAVGTDDGFGVGGSGKPKWLSEIWIAKSKSTVVRLRA